MPAAAQKADVEVGVVRHHRGHVAAHEGEQFRRHRGQGRRIGHILVADAGHLRDEGGDASPRVDERLEAVNHMVALKTDGADLDDGVVGGAQAGRFQVKRNIDALCHDRVFFLGSDRLCHSERSEESGCKFRTRFFAALRMTLA
jgi:hypothetical protein